MTYHSHISFKWLLIRKFSKRTSLYITRLQLPNNDLRNKNTSWWIGDWFDKQGEISEVWGDFGCICFGCFGCNPCSMFLLEDFLCSQKSPPRPHQWVVFFPLRNKKTRWVWQVFPSFGPPNLPQEDQKIQILPRNAERLVVIKVMSGNELKKDPQTVVAKEIRSCFFAHNLP